MPSFCFGAWQVLIVAEWNAPDSTKIIFARLCQFKEHQRHWTYHVQSSGPETERQALAVGLPWYHDDPKSKHLFSPKMYVTMKERVTATKTDFCYFFWSPKMQSYALFDPEVPEESSSVHFIRLRVGRDGGSLNWFGLNYSCVFLSLCLSIPLSFSCGVRITQWYWVHLLYKREAVMDRLACAHTLTFIHKGPSC